MKYKFKLEPHIYRYFKLTVDSSDFQNIYWNPYSLIKKNLFVFLISFFEIRQCEVPYQFISTHLNFNSFKFQFISIHTLVDVRN